MRGWGIKEKKQSNVSVCSRAKEKKKHNIFGPILEVILCIRLQISILLFNPLQHYQSVTRDGAVS